jgi:hypothetical protein
MGHIPYTNLVRPVVRKGSPDAVVNLFCVPDGTVLLEQLEDFPQDNWRCGGRERGSLLKTPVEYGYGGAFAVQETSKQLDAREG